MTIIQVVAVSDIHLDINIKRRDKDFTRKLVQYLSTLSGDILILAGDIAGRTSLLVEFLNLTSDLDFRYKIYVPGNHDVWVNQQAEDLSWTKYYEILPELALQFDWYYLPNNPLVIEHDNQFYGFVGTMGWYDYSTRNQIWDDQLDLQAYENKQHPTDQVELMDRYYVKFGKTDQKMADQFLQDMRDDVQYIQRRYDPSELKEMVFVTHMVPFRQFIQYRGMLKYDYFTAFFGNSNLGAYIQKLTQYQSKHSIFGQTHIPGTRQLSESLMGYCVPIGYPREYGKDLSLTDLFRERVKEINL